jgi:uncharacterized membrane protein
MRRGAIVSIVLARAATVAAMIAIPLLPRGSRARSRLANVVVAGSAVATTAAVHDRWGRRGVAGGIGTVIGTGLIEAVGSRTGVPFGRYRYTRRLRPAIAGVPCAVPLAWWGMAVPARETAHAVLGPRSTPLTRVALGAAALTGWDLFLDPQMVAEGYWSWARRGRYRGIPVTNYLGWLAVSAATMALLERTAPPGSAPDGDLVGQYAGMALFETVGFAAFFRDRGVATVGGAAMLPLAAVAVLRLRRR